MRILSVFMFVVVIVCAYCLSACCGPRCEFNQSLEAQFTGGGEDTIMSELPFESGYSVLCSQGTQDWPSHNATSTKFDVDLDTPNSEDVPVFAPVNGRAYVHDDTPEFGFGIHINIDLGDGTYLILAHLEAAFIDDDSEVAAGQLLGFEGTTGNSSGDHVHFGRHAGDASLDGIFGESFDGLTLNMDDGRGHVQLMTSDMWCDLPDGETYGSLLQTPRWHPNGSLVKTPDEATVYLVESNGLTPFATNDAFVSRNYDYSNAALISDSELACYGVNAAVSESTDISAVYGAFPNQAVWLLMGDQADPDRYRMLIPYVGWQAVLKSWGIIASTYDDLYHDPEDNSPGLVDLYPYAGMTSFRDGSLVSPVEDSAVYVMSDGIAMPIETWDTLLFLGWEDRNIIEMSEDDFESAVTVKGDCGTNTYCLSLDDAQVCGGPDQGQEGVSSSTTPPSLPPINDLLLTWFTPSGLMVDSITLAGAVTPSGQLENQWGTVFNEVLNAGSIMATVPALGAGDSLRFSVEYRDNGIPSWSCLAPYPPGFVQGSVIANYGDTSLGYAAADDPSSDGCGLLITVP